MKQGEPTEDLLVPWFALTREAARRVLGMRPFDVQLLDAAALHAGRIVEMETGEGKTLAAVLPASLEALAGREVHVMTANIPDGSAVRLAAEVKELMDGLHFERDPDGRNVRLTDAGVVGLERRRGLGSLYDVENTPLLAAANVALHARALLARDVEYIVKDGVVRLVEELKGRLRIADAGRTGSTWRSRRRKGSP